MTTYAIISELVDYRDSSRHFPAPPGAKPAEFTPADDTHAQRLIKAGCLAELKKQPANQTPVDELDKLTVAKLKGVAESEQIELGDATGKPEILKVIREARAARSQS